MDLIEPTHFDVIAISSGLPEMLIASALARAGRSVLVLDAADSYGGSWSSLNASDYIQLLSTRCLDQQQQQQLPKIGVNTKRLQKLPGSSQHSTHTSPIGLSPAAPTPAGARRPADQAASSASTAGAPITICLRPGGPLQNATGCALYLHPALQEGPEVKGVIIDQAPRVMYQDEPLVQLLVSCRAHHYLELKLVEGSYIYLDGVLRQVPACRADLFSDKVLSLSDKRSMGRFLSACVEAQQGCGRLKDVFDDRPLQQLLQIEGLSHQLQQVVLYGIAMADVPQHTAQTQPHQQQQQCTESPSLLDAGQAAAGAAEQLGGQRNSSRNSLQLTAAQGLAALQLYSSSLGRYGGSGAFMAPCYGSGSLPEAFVRLAAVQGAVTALRHGVQQLVLGPLGQVAVQAAPDNAGGAGAGAGHGVQDVLDSDVRVPPAAAAAAAPADNVPSLSKAEEPAASGEDVAGQASCGPSEAAGRDSVEGLAMSGLEALAAGNMEHAGITADAAAAARVKVVLASGQQLTAQTVLACRDLLPEHISSSSSSSSLCLPDSSDTVGTCERPTASTKMAVARAVAVLDSSCVEDEGSLLLVFPPCSLGSHQAAVIRGLQLGPAQAVGPPGKYLLHLVAPLPPDVLRVYKSSSASAQGQYELLLAEQVLGPAIAALASVQGLRTATLSVEGNQDAECAAPGCAEGGMPAGSRGSGGRGPSFGCSDLTATPGAPGQQRPQVSALSFFLDTQPEASSATASVTGPPDVEQQAYPITSAQQQGRRWPAASTPAPSKDPLVMCSACPAGLLGYHQVVQAAEALYRQQFPTAPWLTDAMAYKQGAAAAEGGDVGLGMESVGVSDFDQGSEGKRDHDAAEGCGPVESAVDGAGVLDEHELDAIDELTAALQNLSALPATEAGRSPAAEDQLPL